MTTRNRPGGRPADRLPWSSLAAAEAELAQIVTALRQYKSTPAFAKMSLMQRKSLIRCLNLLILYREEILEVIDGE